MEGRKKNMEGGRGTGRERVIRHDRQIIHKEREREREGEREGERQRDREKDGMRETERETERGGEGIHK